MRNLIRSLILRAGAVFTRAGAVLTPAGALLGIVLSPTVTVLGPLSPLPAAASTISVRPTSTPADFGAVRDAMHRLAPGDTLRLEAGVFDWSANLADTSEAVLLPGGLKVPVSGITILGVRNRRTHAETVLRGATGPDGGPLVSDAATNAAFRNAPGVQNVTMKSLTLENFESAIVLLQADSLAAVRPADAFRYGTRGWRIEDVTIRSGPFGIVANGGHAGLAIRGCRFEMRTLPPTAARRGGSFAIALRPFAPLYPGVPRRAVIENNVIRGPAANNSSEMFGGIIVTCDSAQIRSNDVERYALGLLVEGRGIDVSGNRISQGGIGIVAWTTNRLGTKTDRAMLRGNEIRGMRRGAAGLLRDYMGCGMVLAGVTNSNISGNIFSGNPGADIVFGAIQTTPVSQGNHVAGNGGTVLLSKRTFDQNRIEGSQVTVRDLKPPKPDSTDTQR